MNAIDHADELARLLRSAAVGRHNGAEHRVRSGSAAYVAFGDCESEVCVEARDALDAHLAARRESVEAVA